jgi:gas vesicle protein
MNDNGQSFIGFLVGFIVGGLIGAAVALLYAPQSGEETRAVIRDKSIELRDMANESAAEYKARADKTIGDLRVKVEELQLKVAKQPSAAAPTEQPPAA